MLAPWQIAERIANANIGFTKLPESLFEVEGMSSQRGRILLNELCDFPECRYLEVGTYKGSTILAASYRNSGSFTSIDNFSEFGGTLESLLKNSRNFQQECKLQLIFSDAWKTNPASIAPINVFFYDGSHTEADHCRAFTHFDSAFEKEFIAIVDDWNIAIVRNGTRRAFRELGYTVVAEHELYSVMNGDAAGWWNGMYVGLVQKPITVQTC